ncbi:MAG: hypothetical protein H7Z75_16155 [Ferruginibacter sp.]|nr:hypothetical protein [Cytophagales bacterium]
MRKSDTRKAELMSLITRTEDAGQIKSIAKLLGKMDEVMIEEARLAVLKEKLDRLNDEIATELRSYQAAVGEKPKSNRGRKRKVA